MHVQPYLFFDGRCEEALEFYKKAIGAKVEMLLRFKENPEKSSMTSPVDDDKVMHSCFRVGDTALMASDGHAKGKPVFQGVALSITADSDADVDRMFKALAEGGQVQMPLARTFFSSRFGMVADKFGVSWMVLTKQ